MRFRLGRRLDFETPQFEIRKLGLHVTLDLNDTSLFIYLVDCVVHLLLADSLPQQFT